MNNEDKPPVSSRSECPSVAEMVDGRKLKIIRWGDHWGSSGWKPIAEHLEPVNMNPIFNVSVGWEIVRTDTLIKLSQSLCELDRCADVVTILLSEVISEEEVCFE